MYNQMIHYICIPLGYLMKWCWMLVQDYGLAILLFTLATKFVLLPLSVWIQQNSILMVKIQPEINFIKAKHYGDGETISEEQSKLFKREHYHPMLTLIPLILQIILLLGVVEIIYHPLRYLFGIPDQTVQALASYIGADLSGSSYELAVIEAVKSGKLVSGLAIDGVGADALSSVIAVASDFRTAFLGLNLSLIPTEVFGIYLLVPVLAGLSSLALSWTQNLSNVLQHEQSKWNQYGMLAFSVLLSLYLGSFVPAGIALYWIASNGFSIAQMYLLNVAINPKKYVDYEALEKSRAELKKIEDLEANDKKDASYKENKKREKQDYKRFFKVINKHLVIYSEKSGFYKYFKDIIDALLKKSNLTIHYVTNDPNDQIFEIAKSQPRIRPYYIGLKKLIPLMMLLESDVVLMTTPDLEKFYIKRSLVDKNVEYIYAPHDMMSMHMGFREGALDEFDTVFCTGEHIVKEVRKSEEVYGTKQKTLVPFGYPLSDLLVEAGKEERKTHTERTRKQILIAPSWQEDNLLDSCIDALISGLYGEQYRIIVRPHPEYVKRYGARMQEIVERYRDRDPELLTFELDFSQNQSIYSSDLLITDWSGIAPEFCFATNRPALFVNTQIKCLNPNWENLGLTPVEISLRNELGVAVEKEDLAHVGQIVSDLFAQKEHFEKAIPERFASFLFNHGCAGEAGADYILGAISKKHSAKKN